jgi:hypothetical protein
MKKICLSLIFLILSGASFGIDLQNRHIYIDGQAEKWEHLSIFMYNFMMEASNLGYTFADTKEEAAYTFKFEVVPNLILYDDGTEEPAPPDEKQFLLLSSVIRNSDETEFVTFGFPFTEVDEMYAFTQILFVMAMLNVPLSSDEDTALASIDESAVIAQESLIAQESPQDGPVLTNEDEEESPVLWQENPAVVADNEDWKNKRLYARASVDYPFSFYLLKQDGLHEGALFKAGESDVPLDGIRFVALPGITVGVGYQVLDWMSGAATFKVSMGIPDNFLYFNMAAALQVKFPIKFIRNIMLEPYGAFSYLLNPAPAFDKFPLFAVGGGIQVGIKGGNNGSFFADLNFMYSLGDAFLFNTRAGYSPSVIHYQHFVIGVGVGYKYGFF